jgi:predicted nucleic acid-binding Zn ribbon protein
MIYPFECPECGLYHEEIAHHTEMPTGLKCPDCNTDMIRQFPPSQVNVPKTGYYDPGLSIYVRNKRDVRDAIKKHHDKTGKTIEEVGNENNKPKKVKHNYNKMIDDLASGGAFENIDNAKSVYEGGQDDIIGGDGGPEWKM